MLEPGFEVENSAITARLPDGFGLDDNHFELCVQYPDVPEARQDDFDGRSGEGEQFK